MKSLKKLFKKYNIDGYIIPKNDEYFNEYVSSSQDRLKFISSFSGSAGFSIILKNKNYLFVDGRYTTQAGFQSGNKFKITTIPNKYPKDIIKLKKKLILGFDPKLHTERNLNSLFRFKKIKLKAINQNLVDKIWKNKPKDSVKPFFSISSKITGLSRDKKIKKIKKLLIKNKVDYLLVTAPENVGWLLNIRGDDSPYSPIPNSRLLINKKGEIDLFANSRKIKNLKNNRIRFHIEKALENKLYLISKKKFWVDVLTCSFFYKNLINKKNKVFDKIDPIYFFKSIKNNTEIKNMKRSHLFDGVALSKFMIWIKRNFNKIKISELSAQRKLENFRKKNNYYKCPSFSTISGSGPNSAIIHYKASNKTNRYLKKGELYLVDSGGQYFYGTTDVTRTISLQNKSKYIKEIYTRVLKGHIAVSKFNIKINSTGSKVDKVARQYLQKIKLDFPHGTGHGVGYFSNVHEGPQSLSKNNKIYLKDGMVLSNEPGYYKDGFFGIRIENLIYIKKNKFEELTLAPIEKDLINKDFLNKNEIEWINNYHQRVKDNLIRFMNSKEKKYFLEACSPI